MKFLLSLDLELGVGPRKRLTPASRERDTVMRLIDLFEKYEVCATWAIVGHLFLSDCDKHDLPFNDCSDPKWQRVLYAPDLVEKILDSSMKHEVASHGFAHIDYSASSEASIKADIMMALQAMQEFNIKPRSFIFPWNSFDFRSLKIVKSFGFNFTRASMGFMDDTAPLECVPFLTVITEQVPLKYIFNLFNALRNSEIIFHLWTHPADWRRLNAIEQILRKVKKEEILSVRMKEGYKFGLPNKEYNYTYVSSFPITYSHGRIGFNVYYVNLTCNNIVRRLNPFPHRLLCKISDPSFKGHAKKVKIKDSSLIVERKSIGYGLLSYRVPMPLIGYTKIVYEMARRCLA